MLHSCATFEICVMGWLDAAWIDYISANEITFAEDGEKSPLTILTLQDADQSMLIGTINTLFGLGVPLVSVRQR